MALSSFALGHLGLVSLPRPSSIRTTRNKKNGIPQRDQSSRMARNTQIQWESFDLQEWWCGGRISRLGEVRIGQTEHAGGA